MKKSDVLKEKRQPKDKIVNIAADDLTKKEQNILNILNAVGSMREEQIDLVNQTIRESELTRAKRTLIRNQFMFQATERKTKKKIPGIYVSRPWNAPDKDTIDALWIPLAKISGIKTSQFYKPKYPACVGFVKSNSCYEVIVCKSDNIVKNVKKIEQQHEENSFNNDREYVQYIFVVKNKGLLEKFPRDIKVPYIIAVENYVAEGGLSIKKKPDIIYFKPKN